MNQALLRTGIRYLGRHPWPTALMILGIALGVAVMVAVDLANSAASRAFDLSTDAVAGKATHQIVGGPQGLDESLYAALRVEAGVQAAAPVITDYFTSPELGNRTLQLLGVDPFAEAPFRSYLAPTGGGPAGPQVEVDRLTAFLVEPGALLMSEDLAAEYGLDVGDEITVDFGGRQSQGTIAGLLRPADRLSQRALQGLLLADISTAQELTGRLGRLDHIDLILSQDNARLADAISALLPPDAQLVPASARSGAVAEMTAAFRLNLSALSLLALVVGTFLIYNSMTFSVVQRRPLFGTLRCLGATGVEIGVLVLSEAFVVGLLGSLLGLGLGVLLGQGAVRLVTQTINDLYFVVTVRGVAIAGSSLLKGLVLGVLATAIAAAVPAWEAASVPPQIALRRSALEDKTRRLVPLTAIAGVAGLLLGLGLLALPTRNLPVSFGGIFAVVIGFALTAPLVTLVLLRAVLPVTNRLFGVLGRMAPRRVMGTLSRTAVAIAALMVAVSVTIGVGLMVGSFRSTVIDWLDQTLAADIYISAPSLTATRPTMPLDPEVWATAQTWPGVQDAQVLRSVDVAFPQGRVAVSAVSDPDFATDRMFVSVDGGPQQAAQAVQQGAVLASEPLANRLRLPARAATITLYTDRGPHTFPVAGIYRDYSSSQGTVMMALDLYRSYWDDPEITAVSLQLVPGADPDQVARALQNRLANVQGVIVRANAALRSDVLEVFDRAFAITGALQLLAAIVAFIGVLSALLSLQLEQSRELGLLRAIGMTTRQMGGIVLLETGLMGSVAGLLAMPTGLALSLILIYIINRRSFGWTLQLQLEPQLFLQALLLAVLAALMAGLYPALRLGRMLAAEALRGE